MTRQHLELIGHDRVVCCTCGNAADQLRAAGLDVLEIGPRGAFEPKRWLSQSEIARAFPHRFDATAGHLPMQLMLRVAGMIREHWRPAPAQSSVSVPAGSGETALCMKLAWPNLHVRACYNLGTPGTQWHAGAPLNLIVALLCETTRGAQLPAAAAA